MKNSELKNEIETLLLNMAELVSSKEVGQLVFQLSNLVTQLDNEEEVSSKTRDNLCSILDEFWLWVRSSLPGSKWREGLEINPWLNFQAKLANAQLIAENYHHAQMHHYLSQEYARLGDGQLELAKLLPLIISCSRINGYALLNELGTYPLERMKTSVSQMEQFNFRQETGKQKTKMTTTAIIFYLVHHYCTAEQIALLPQLIFFRPLTTNEERRSEQAIIHSLFHDSPGWQLFFTNKSLYIDSRELNIIKGLGEIRHLLPKSHPELIKSVDVNRWIYPFLNKTRTSTLVENDKLVKDTVKWLQTEFATYKNKSYATALDFAARVQSQCSFMTDDEVKTVQSALYLFCLNQYEIDRRTDKRKDSFFAFSGATKCDASSKNP